MLTLVFPECCVLMSLHFSGSPNASVEKLERSLLVELWETDIWQQLHFLLTPSFFHAPSLPLSVNHMQILMSPQPLTHLIYQIIYPHNSTFLQTQLLFIFIPMKPIIVLFKKKNRCQYQSLRQTGTLCDLYPKLPLSSIFSDTTLSKLAAWH